MKTVVLHNVHCRLCSNQVMKSVVFHLSKNMSSSKCAAYFMCYMLMLFRVCFVSKLVILTCIVVQGYGSC